MEETERIRKFRDKAMKKQDDKSKNKPSVTSDDTKDQVLSDNQACDMASHSALADWNRPEEDIAWANL